MELKRFFELKDTSIAELSVVSLERNFFPENKIQISFFTGSYRGWKFFEFLVFLISFSVIFFKIWLNFVNLFENIIIF